MKQIFDMHQRKKHSRFFHLIQKSIHFFVLDNLFKQVITSGISDTCNWIYASWINLTKIMVIIPKKKFEKLLQRASGNCKTELLINDTSTRNSEQPRLVKESKDLLILIWNVKEVWRFIIHSRDLKDDFRMFRL